MKHREVAGVGQDDERCARDRSRHVFGVLALDRLVMVAGDIGGLRIKLRQTFGMSKRNVDAMRP